MKNTLDPSAAREVKPGLVLRRRGVLALVLREWDEDTWVICPVKQWTDDATGWITALDTPDGRLAAMPGLAGGQWKELVALWQPVARATEKSAQNTRHAWEWQISGGELPDAHGGPYSKEDWDLYHVISLGCFNDPVNGESLLDCEPKRKCRRCPMRRFWEREEGERWNPLTGRDRGASDCAALMPESFFAEFDNRTCVRGCMAAQIRAWHVTLTPFQEKRLHDMESNPPKRGVETVRCFYNAQFLRDIPEDEGDVPGTPPKHFTEDPDPRDPTVKYADEVIGSDTVLGSRLGEGWDEDA